MKVRVFVGAPLMTVSKETVSVEKTSRSEGDVLISSSSIHETTPDSNNRQAHRQSDRFIGRDQAVGMFTSMSSK